ncbi:hypothetical protein B0A48_03084 [Cryoendolithus antarcticus]|uniref:Protein SYS1 n=1 Tax=Cryoendolithus antarcticus TaxID=1507870 RepID=A0A1V8TMJ0_9PEZI|nr:hypothetical protein B0A48_03084 [Cryoendolithus antarcticus]
MARRRRPPRPGALADLSPLRILTQIALLQLFYYAASLILIIFTTFVAGRHPDPGLFFDWRELRADVTTGWTLGLCWMLGSLITVIPILLLIARSKLVPDFAITIHGLHLIVTSLYSRAIPTALYWWVVQAASATLMVFLGMWACQWRELQPMAFGAKIVKPARPQGSAEAEPLTRASGERMEGDFEMLEMGRRDGTG